MRGNDEGGVIFFFCQQGQEQTTKIPRNTKTQLKKETQEKSPEVLLSELDIQRRLLKTSLNSGS
jgi:hypothetical protein